MSREKIQQGEWKPEWEGLREKLEALLKAATQAIDSTPGLEEHCRGFHISKASANHSDPKKPKGWVLEFAIGFTEKDADENCQTVTKAKTIATLNNHVSREQLRKALEKVTGQEIQEDRMRICGDENTNRPDDD